MTKKAQDYDTVKSASPEMQEFIKEIDDLIDALKYSSDDPKIKLHLATRLLEMIEEKKKERGLI